MSKRKLYICCCNCGRVLGQLSVDSQMEIFCPKCGAEITYTVEEFSVAVQMSGVFADQQKMKVRRVTKGDMTRERVIKDTYSIQKNSASR